uniref:Uncharacterized protein n=1 Tax=Anguilla anguilla TaxID=7936 RepID=A0A0E9UJG2_ANGAN
MLHWVCFISILLLLFPVH